MIEKILSPAFLVILSSKSYGTAPIIALYVVLMIIVLKVNPYQGKRKNYRPVANYLIMIIIAGILLGIAFSADPSGALATYGPFGILILLLVSVVYSAYALIREFI